MYQIKRLLKNLSIVLSFIVLIFDFANSENIANLSVGDYFPTIKLPQNFNQKDLDYLKIEKSDSFYLEQIGGDIIIVEFLNKYCASCQSQAPVYNKLYKILENDKNLSGKVKFIGIGVGNNPYQLKSFVKQKNIAFPLVSDINFTAYNLVGEPRTPYTLILKKIDNKTAIISSIHSGYNENIALFLDEINFTIKSSVKEIIAKKVLGEKLFVKRESKFSEQELVNKIKIKYKEYNINLSNIKLIEKLKSINIYKAQEEHKDFKKLTFIAQVYRPTVCDVCHDVHFWFAFDNYGIISMFESIQLTKLNNELWTDSEIKKIRALLVGKNIKDKFSYNSEVDGVTSATITSAIIFDVFSKIDDTYTILLKKKHITK